MKENSTALEEDCYLKIWPSFRTTLLLFLLSFCTLQTFAQMIVSGEVRDADTKEGLPGVSVVVKGSNTGAVTDPNGSFRLEVASGDAILVFSFIGYVTQEVEVGNMTQVNVSLSPDLEQLSEVVVVGYGTQTKGTITGAIGNVDAEVLARTPSSTTSGALVGKIQGITARQGDARPGGTTNIQIRNMGNPLFIIDGVPADAGQFNNLGQNDIESISILKDASAAIYGLRAANGVILVTTKKGKIGAKPTINLSGYYGLQNFTRYPRPANAYQHMRASVEADMNRNGQTNITPEELEKWRVGTEKGYQSFDYYDMVMEPNVPQYQVSGSASGGSERVNYFVSLTHLNQDALIKDYNFNRTNFQANIDVGLTKRLTVGTQLSGRIEDRYQVGVPGLDDYFNPFLSIFTMWPTERPYANDNPAYINQTHNVNVNPATYKKDVTGYVNDVWRGIKGNFYAEYGFDFGLKARGTYSYNYTNFDFNGFEYTYDAYRYDEATDTYYTQDGWGNQNPWRERRKRNIVDRFAQFQLSYEKQFGNHKIAAVAAYERWDTQNHYMVVHTVPPNNYIPIMSFADQDLLIDEIYTEARAGYILRMNYNFKQKYLLEVLGRYDGSFLYQKDDRWGLFPGVSAGWVISEEPFVKNNIGSVLSNLKFRASYGKIGSDRLSNDNFVVAPFSYLPGYNFIPTPGGSAILNGNFVAGVDPRDPPITNLSWLTNITKNIGVDFGLFNDKLSGSFDVFERVRKGLPAPNYDVFVPLEIGYLLPQENLNTDAHRGIEGALSYASKFREVEYSIGVNGTIARRRDIHYVNNTKFGNSWDEYRNSYEKRWADINWGYQVVGQFQSQEQIDNHPINNDERGNRTMLPGDFIYKDVNGDGTINAMDERPIGYAQGANPYFSFGINGSLAYKGVSLIFGFAGASLQTITRDWEMRYPFQNNGTSPDYMFEDRWHREDPFNLDSRWIAGTYPAIRRDSRALDASYNRHSDFWLTNIRYIRLRNLELGYQLPEKIISKVGVNTMRIYISGTNLFSIDNTKEFGFDPEITAGNSLIYPQQKLYTLGLNLSF